MGEKFLKHFIFVLAILLMTSGNTGMAASETGSSSGHGRIGVGTWKTQAEFRFVRVTKDGKALYASDFDPGSPGWPYTRGEWNVIDDAYRQTEMDPDCRAFVGDPAWTDYTLTLEAQKIAGQEGFLIFFRVSGDEQYCIWSLGGSGNTQDVLARHDGDNGGALDHVIPCHIDTGSWYRIQVSVQGSHIQCWLDGALVHDVVVGQSPQAVQTPASPATR
jgi:hypothetical protein